MLRLSALGLLVGLLLPVAPELPVRPAPPPARADTTSYERAPDFALEQLDGDTFRLSEQRGKVVVVNFWATWCGPCRIEIPGFIRLQEEYAGEGFTFVGVALDEEGAEVVRPFAERMGINYPIVVDDGSVARKYGGIYAVPMSFVIDPEGRVRYVQPGLLPAEALRPVLEEMLRWDDGRPTTDDRTGS